MCKINSVEVWKAKCHQTVTLSNSMYHIRSKLCKLWTSFLTRSTYFSSQSSNPILVFCNVHLVSLLLFLFLFLFHFKIFFIRSNLNYNVVQSTYYEVLKLHTAYIMHRQYNKSLHKLCFLNLRILNYESTDATPSKPAVM